MIPTIYNLPDAYRGDTYGPLLFTFNDVTGGAVNLDGASVACQVRCKKTGDLFIEWLSSDGTAEINGNKLLLMGVSGEYMKIPATTYEHDMQIAHTGGNIKTYIRGDLKVLQDVTDI